MNGVSETNANFRGLQHVLSQGICVIVFYKCLRGFQILLYYDAYQFQQLVVGNGSKNLFDVNPPHILMPTSKRLRTIGVGRGWQGGLSSPGL